MADSSQAADSSEDTSSQSNESFEFEGSNTEKNESVADADSTGATLAADEQYCSSCGSVIKEEATICPECGVEQDDATDNNPGVAALLSGVGIIIPIAAGAGQIYNGQLTKGIILSVIQIINALLIFVVIGWLTYPIVGIYAIYDAYKNA
jgi:TM2 domain-containing membrane protein YozV